jgi:hypothetical protein
MNDRILTTLPLREGPVPDGVPDEVILVVDETRELIWLLFWRMSGEGPVEGEPGWWDDEYQRPAQILADCAEGRASWCWVRQRESMIEEGDSLLDSDARALREAQVAGSPALAGGALPGVGYAFQPESLDVRMAARSFRTIEWVGDGPEPEKHRPWVEWIREKIFRLEPRWRPIRWPVITGGRARLFVGDTLVGTAPPAGLCHCPLERLGRGLPHLDECPRAKGGAS